MEFAGHYLDSSHAVTLYFLKALSWSNHRTLVHFLSFRDHCPSLPHAYSLKNCSYIVRCFKWKDIFFSVTLSCLDVWYLPFWYLNLYVNSIFVADCDRLITSIPLSFPPLLYLYSLQYNSLILSIKRKHPLLHSWNLDGLVTCFDWIIF